MRKLLVITGGSKGIGRAIIEKFASQGFDVITCSRHAEELGLLKSEIEKKFAGTTLQFQAADMASKNETKLFADFVVKQNRNIDVLVNNAGYFIPGEITTEAEGTLESMINANLYSAYYTTRGLAEKMKHAGAGHIFNMCSIASIRAYANGGSYAISKFAMLGLSKCLREELKSFNIRVTAIMPGATRTRSWEGVDLPDDRFMSVEDIADTVYAAWALSGRSVIEEIIIRPQLGDI
jgi:short-subunit dehydrogenase